MLYKDGVTEARSRMGVEYGLDRLSEVLANRHGYPARDVAAIIREDLETFRLGTARADDVSIMVIRRAG